MNEEKTANADIEKGMKETVEQYFIELPINWKWMLALGIVMIILGTLGISMSVVLTLASMLLFAVLVGTAGILQLIQGLQAKEEKWIGRFQHFIVALLYLVTAGLIYWDPIAASQGMTLVLAGLFAAIGVTRIIDAIRCKRRQWKWLLPVLLGIINILFAVFVVIGWPATGLWVIGLFVAIELVMNGWLITLIALRARQVEKAL